MKTLRIVLNGGLQSCCSVYPPEMVKEIVDGWTEGICNLEVMDAKEGEWKSDELARNYDLRANEQTQSLIYWMCIVQNR